MTGKGGTGKTAVAAALGLLGARSGRRTVVAEVGGRREVPRLAPSVDHLSIDPDRAMEAYLGDQLGSHRSVATSSASASGATATRDSVVDPHVELTV